MDAFEKWRKDYGDRMHAQGIVRNPTDEEAFRAGMRAAAALCHAKADAVFAANPGRKRGTVSGIGGYAGHLIKDFGSAILAEADK